MKTSEYTTTLILAYADRYVYPIVILLFLIKKRFLIAGVLSLIWAIYKLIGYKLKWKHIFCSYQNAAHQKMTPGEIDWSMVKKSDVYVIPAVFSVIGIFLIFISLCG